MLVFFLFKQKTAYEMRISDWGSDVCSSDLKPGDERPGEENSAEAIANRASASFKKFHEGMAFAFIPPAALELGNATGFSFVITDDNNLGHLKLAAARDKLLAAATKDPRLAGVRIFGQKEVGQQDRKRGVAGKR